ncbi:class I SAM-dependent methyltransferase [Oscillatoria sp. CS-180]|uniref:class I SAM-dependent methyltransferase n=1 Tax=Oscillatoria sp. CS-180 TaxID=3021720 RepID=UPI002330F904|nr:class I SAM-dependent methyltransferase [Oscillatoria sp. CS-180]MDB9525418.1 class I SAM-dependent methyltransferase [Oscillatoria sp. CS-180]
MPSLSDNDTSHFQHRWSNYYEAVEGRPPRETLLTALKLFDAERPRNKRAIIGNAVDLGCGDGRDTVELLRRNWRVLAIDGEPEAIARLSKRPDINRTYLETRVQKFEDIALPPDVDLINASFCLPFCSPSYFSELWEEIVVALRPGGRFCGHLFGDHDSWATYSDITCHTRSQVEALFHPFDIERLDEEDHPGKTALGEEKHWHLFNMVACKR